MRVGGDYLLSGTAQSFPGLCQPFLWETGSPESSVTKQTSERWLSEILTLAHCKECSQRPTWYGQQRGTMALTPRKGREKDNLYSNSHPSNTTARVTYLDCSSYATCLSHNGCQTSNCGINACTFFKPQMASRNTSYTTPSSQWLLQHQGKWHWNSSNGNQNRELVMSSRTAEHVDEVVSVDLAEVWLSLQKGSDSIGNNEKWVRSQSQQLNRSWGTNTEMVVPVLHIWVECKYG